jgi:hypothetical protein
MQEATICNSKVSGRCTDLGGVSKSYTKVTGGSMDL